MFLFILFVVVFLILNLLRFETNSKKAAQPRTAPAKAAAPVKNTPQPENAAPKYADGFAIEASQEPYENKDTVAAKYLKWADNYKPSCQFRYLGIKEDNLMFFAACPELTLPEQNDFIDYMDQKIMLEIDGEPSNFKDTLASFGIDGKNLTENKITLTVTEQDMHMRYPGIRESQKQEITSSYYKIKDQKITLLPEGKGMEIELWFYTARDMDGFAKIPELGYLFAEVIHASNISL
ncbi:hypothetical protein Dip510_001187 [Elusimicrobium posterum]|uniref:hypothetical protein n=1 Tax=Elusimicrobium posterum TaxID=3116653 RepID=UPI003C75872E